VAVSIVLTDPSCVHFTAMRRYITDELLRVDGVESVDVVMSTTQLWTPDRMHPAGPPEDPARPSARGLLPLLTR
jgi:metal-sulfur cluster biosynthetic enzyme